MANDRYASQVRAITLSKLEELQKWVVANQAKDKSHFNWINYQIDLFKDDPSEYKNEGTIDLPDGSPIGSELQCNY